MSNRVSSGANRRSCFFFAFPGIYYWLFGFGLGLLQPAQAQYVAPAVDPLARPVQLPATTAPLEDVLRALASRSGISLSYSADRLPLRSVITVPAGPPVPLRTALVNLTRNRPIAWALLEKDVLVLWRRGDKPPAGVLPDRASMLALQRAGTDYQTKPGLMASTITDNHNRSGRPVAGSPPARRHKPSRRTPESAVALSAASGANLSAAVGQAGAVSTSLAAVAPANNAESRIAANQPSVDRRPPSSTSAPARPPLVGLLLPRYAALRTTPSDDSTQASPPLQLSAVRMPRVRALSPWERHTVQVSLVPPLSTNWRSNVLSVNRVSLNLLVGRAAGVDGLELGGLMNIEHDSVRGAQAAGVANVVSGPLDGVQFAVVFNVAGGPSQGWQSAGVFNRVGHAHGPDGTTAAEPLWQVSGLMNLAPAGIKGAQIAGLLNVARKVHGVQLAGFLNVADTVEGVSLAPLNFVWRGYHALEITTSSAWPLNLTLKLGGSPAFYTYFTGAMLPRSDSARWGIGYGLGAELAARRRFSVSIDAQAMQVNEDNRAWATLGQALNLHNQIKVQAGWAIGRKRKLRLLAGPSLSVFVTKRRDAQTGRVTSRVISENAGLFGNSGSDAPTHFSGWVEALAGVRWLF